MSLRPEIYGFDLARLRALLGSGNESAVERAAAELEQREHAEEAKDIAARAILTGVPFVGLDVEGDAHVTAAVTLFRMDQTLDEVGSHVWNMTPIWDLARLLPSLSRSVHASVPPARRPTRTGCCPSWANFDGWLGRISGAGRDLFFFTA